MQGKSVLISGIGIAGPALAYWLLRHGFSPTLVEHAPALRNAGYIIDFWGLGYDITEKMGLLPAIRRAGYRIREVRIVDAHGQRVGGFDAEVFREATFGRYTSLPRGELSSILVGAIEHRAELVFGDTIVGLEQEEDGVLARFQRAPARRFDLVVGADGLHSAVRALALGPEPAFEERLGYTVAAFEAPGYEPRDEDVYVAYCVPGRQIARFSMRGDRTMILFVGADAGPQEARPNDTAAAKAYLRERLAGMGWECPHIVSAMEDCAEIYFDPVSQIRMPHWSLGRVALVGDAAYAPSLLAGQGSALAIIGAYVLAGELARAEHHEDAFAAYERRLRPFLLRKQNAARRFASAFAPRTHLGLTLRNFVTKAFALPRVAKLAFGRGLLDRLALPDYEQVDPTKQVGLPREAKTSA